MSGAPAPRARPAALAGALTGVVSGLVLAGISAVDGNFTWALALLFGLWMALATGAVLYWLPRWRGRR